MPGRQFKRKCVICGKAFETNYPRKYTCSEECASIRTRNVNNAYRKRTREEVNRRARERYYEIRAMSPNKERQRPDGPTLDEKIAAAQAMGMTYGQYVLMLRKQKGEA